MPLDIEERQDISGDPQPAHPMPGAQLKGAQKAKVNQMRRGPRPEPTPSAGKEEAQHGRSEESGADPAGSSTTDQPPQPKDTSPQEPIQPPVKPPVNPYAPVNWEELQREDPASAYYSAKDTLSHLTTFMNGTGISELPGDAVRHVEAVWSAADDWSAINQSIQNIWGQNNAQAAVARFLLSGNVKEAFAPTQAGGQRAGQVAGTGLSIAANPENALGLGAGGLAGRLALVAGPQVLQALGEQGQNASIYDLTWAALTGVILSRGHLPPGASEQVSRTLGRWPQLEGAMKSILGLHRDYKSEMSMGSRAAYNAIRDTFHQGVPAKTTTLAHAAQKVTPGLAAPGTLFSSGAGRKAALKAAGVGSVPELIAKAQSEGFSDKAVMDAVVKNYSALGLKSDLRRVVQGDVALGDPGASLTQLHNLGDAARTAAYHQSLTRHEAFMGHIADGLWVDMEAAAHNAGQAILTNLAGHNRRGGSTDILYHSMVDQWQSLMKTHAIDGKQLSRAITGDEEAFAALNEEGQGIARQWRTMGNGVMAEAQRLGKKDFQDNWLPFIFEDRPATLPRAAAGAGGRVGAFVRASEAHKDEMLRADEEGNLYISKRFHSPQEANAEFARMQTSLVSELTSPGTPLRDELKNVKWAKDIRGLSIISPKEALAQARQAARQYYPSFEEDFLKIARTWNARGLKSLRTTEALGHLTEALMKDGEAAAVKVNAGSHEADTWTRMGYKPVVGDAYRNYLFHPDFHATVERYVGGPSRQGLQETPGIGKPLPVKVPGTDKTVKIPSVLGVEGKAVGLIVFSPPIHFMNMAARLGAATIAHPLQITHYLRSGGPLSPLQDNALANEYRKFAIEAGGIPPTRGGHTLFDNLSARQQEALGSIDDELEKIEAQQPSLASKLVHADKMMNDWVWNHYRDFATMMTHVEYVAARRHGFSETESKLMAGRAGASWSGLANPENQSPMIHDLMRVPVLAPGYWFSFGQLMIPMYRRIGMNPRMAAYMAYRGAKFIAAAWLFQHITGNLANYALTSTTPWSFDGHFQNENLPGNQDKIEATAPWLNQVPGFAGIAPEVPKTGGRRTIENPVARQMYALEASAGLESGQPDWKPSDAMDGTSKMAIGRVSPLLDALAAAGNIDLYRTVTTGQIEHIDPNQPVGPSASSALWALLTISPLGSQYAQKVAASMSDPNAQTQVDGPFGLKVPKAVGDVLGNTGQAVDRMLFGWLTGINPAYDYAPRSRGTGVSDQQYQTYAKAKTTYQTEMGQASAKALGGQMTPYEYLNGTSDGKWPGAKKVKATYDTVARSTFQDAPHYTQGAEGLLSSYDDLYNQAAIPASQGGGIDYAKLDQLQATWTQKNASSPFYPQMQQILQQNDTKFPMEALYHKTLSAYGKWQESYAQGAGVDINTLRGEISAYGALYSDRTASQRYLNQHRDLAAYESAKKRQWDTSPAGLMYGLFYNTSTAATYMQQHHLSPQEVEQEAQAAS